MGTESGQQSSSFTKPGTDPHPIITDPHPIGIDPEPPIRGPIDGPPVLPEPIDPRPPMYPIDGPPVLPEPIDPEPPVFGPIGPPMYPIDPEPPVDPEPIDPKPIDPMPIIGKPRPIDPMPIIGKPGQINPMPIIGKPRPINPMPILGRPRPAPIQPLDTGGGGGGGAGQVQVDLAHLTTTGTNATQLGADMLSTVQRGSSGLAEVGQHTGWAISGALGRCAAGWQAELTSTSQAVGTIGTCLADTVARYRDTDNTNATAFGSIGQEIQA